MGRLYSKGVYMQTHGQYVDSCFSRFTYNLIKCGYAIYIMWREPKIQEKDLQELAKPGHHCKDGMQDHQEPTSSSQDKGTETGSPEGIQRTTEGSWTKHPPRQKKQYILACVKCTGSSDQEHHKDTVWDHQETIGEKIQLWQACSWTRWRNTYQTSGSTGTLEGAIQWPPVSRTSTIHRSRWLGNISTDNAGTAPGHLEKGQ